MRASLALPFLAALTLAPAAHAQQPTTVDASPSTIEITPPAGWTLDADLTDAQVRTLRKDAHLGGQGVRAVAAFYRSTPPGAGLIVSQVVAEPAPADAAGVARAELASLRGVVEAVQGTLVTWRFQGGEPALPEARLEWKDPGLATTSITRALVFRTEGALMVATAECVLAGDADALRAPCEAAMASMRPLPALARTEVGMGAGDPVTAVAQAAAPPVEPAVAGTSSTRGPTMAEHTGDLPTTILVRPPAKPTDRRPLYLFGGVAILALVFLWNRRQRARLDAAEERERQRAERRGRAEPAARTPDDDKADDGKGDAKPDAAEPDAAEPDGDKGGDAKPDAAEPDGGDANEEKHGKEGA